MKTKWYEQDGVCPACESATCATKSLSCNKMKSDDVCLRRRCNKARIYALVYCYEHAMEERAIDRAELAQEQKLRRAGY